MQPITPPKDLVPVTARGEATRAKLIAAAEAEFTEKGFHAASVNSITGRAGVGQGTFYLYFHSKDEILVTLVRDCGRSLRKQMVERSAGARGEGERARLQVFLDFVREHPGILRIVQECQAVDEGVYRQHFELLADVYAAGMREAIQHGTMAPGDVEGRAWAMLGIGHFLGLRWCVWQNRLPEPRVVNEAIDLFLPAAAAGRPSRAARA